MGRSESNSLASYAVVCVLLLVTLGFGWVLWQGDGGTTDGEEDETAWAEPLEDPVELKMIRGLEIGDDLADVPQLATLVDKIHRPADDRFAQLYEYLAKTKPSFMHKLSEFPKDPSACEVYYFDLRSIEHEGAKSYYVVVEGTKIIAVIVGEYWLA